MSEMINSEQLNMCGETKDDLPQVRQHTPLQTSFLHRLQQLLQKRREVPTEMPASEKWLLHVLDNALYSAYMDCLSQGIGEEAQALLKDEETLVR